MVRKAIANYIQALDDQGEDIPYLQSIQTAGVAWDWMKPCYHDVITTRVPKSNYTTMGQGNN